MVNIPPLQIDKVFKNRDDNDDREEPNKAIFDLKKDYELEGDFPDSPKMLGNKKRFKSPSLKIETGGEDDFIGERIPTDVHYESDSREMSSDKVRVDLISDNCSEKRPRSATKRDLYASQLIQGKVSGSFNFGKAGGLRGARGATPPALKRGKMSTSV